MGSGREEEVGGFQTNPYRVPFDTVEVAPAGAFQITSFVILSGMQISGALFFEWCSSYG